MLRQLAECASLSAPAESRTVSPYRCAGEASRPSQASEASADEETWSDAPGGRFYSSRHRDSSPEVVLGIDPDSPESKQNPVPSPITEGEESSVPPTKTHPVPESNHKLSHYPSQVRVAAVDDDSKLSEPKEGLFLSSRKTKARSRSPVAAQPPQGTMSAADKEMNNIADKPSDQTSVASITVVKKATKGGVAHRIPHELVLSSCRDLIGNLCRDLTVTVTSRVAPTAVSKTVPSAPSAVISPDITSVTPFEVAQGADVSISGARDDGAIIGVQERAGASPSGTPALCTICSKMFSNPSNLRQHYAIRHSSLQRPFKCDSCDKRFNTESNLRQHRRTHTGERPFPCPYCYRAFGTSTNLRQHERTHTGERPFTCSDCPRAFATSSNLRQHQRIHTGERPFGCSVCAKKFSSSTNLRQHMRTHNNPKRTEVATVLSSNLVIDDQEADTRDGSLGGVPSDPAHTVRSIVFLQMNDRTSPAVAEVLRNLQSLKEGCAS